MLNVENLKKALEAFQKNGRDDTPLWERLDEIYGNPLIRAYFEGYYSGWGGFNKFVYVCEQKEKYQEFHDKGYRDGKEDRFIDENFHDNCSKHS